MDKPIKIITDLGAAQVLRSIRKDIAMARSRLNRTPLRPMQRELRQANFETRLRALDRAIERLAGDPRQ